MFVSAYVAFHESSPYLGDSVMSEGGYQPVPEESASTSTWFPSLPIEGEESVLHNKSMSKIHQSPVMHPFSHVCHKQALWEPKEVATSVHVADTPSFDAQDIHVSTSASYMFLPLLLQSYLLLTSIFLLHLASVYVLALPSNVSFLLHD